MPVDRGRIEQPTAQRRGMLHDEMLRTARCNADHALPDRHAVQRLDDVRQALLALHESDDAQLLDEFFGGHKLIAAHTADYDAVRAAMF